MTADPYSLAALRSNLWHFLTGRIVSGLLSFLILMLLVRLLPVAQFGIYVSLVAGLELAINVCGLGLPWVVARYLPQLRLLGSRPRVRQFIWVTSLWSTALLTGAALLVATLLAFAPAGASSWSGHADLIRVYLVVTVLEGAARHLRDGVLGSLMLHARARIGLVLRQSLFIGGLLLVWHAGDRGIHVASVVRLELLACILSLSVSLWHVVLAVRDLPQREPTDDASTNLPGFMSMWRSGLSMYLALLFSQPYQPATLLLLLQHYHGLQAAALFGFLKSIYEQACRYLPTALLHAVIRPKLIAAAVGGASLSTMSQLASFISRLGLLSAAPLLALTLVAGPELLGYLSGGRLHQEQPLLLAMVLLVVVYGRRQLLEGCAVAINASGACLRAALLSLVGVLVAWLLLLAGSVVWAPIVGMAAGQTIFTLHLHWLTAPHAMNMAGLWQDFKALLISGLAALLAYPVHHHAAGVLALALQGSICVVVVVVLAWRFPPLLHHERERINSFVGRRLLS